MSAPAAPVLTHLLRLLDDTGIVQHATYSVPARAHGYCLDDNSRGLMLAARLRRHGAHPAADMLFSRTAAFVQHAWNADAGRFRNFMGYDRRWLEAVGSEDSHGRAVQALGATVRDAPDEDARGWALELLDRAVPPLASFTSPRALAAGLLGLAAAATVPRSSDWAELRDRLAGRLGDHLYDNRRSPDWLWFEASLSYDNARLCEAVLAAGAWAGRREWIAAGLETLGWLCRAQMGEDGCFAPIGSEGFWRRGETRAQFDQQPLEAAATVSAALLAWRLDGNGSWLDEAERAHAWFRGRNDLGQALASPETGGCRDGLHPTRVNRNHGAESTLAWLQADLDIGQARAAVHAMPAAAE